MGLGGGVGESVVIGGFKKATSNYNASTNTPPLVDGSGKGGIFYIVSVGATRTFGPGNTLELAAGDYIFYSEGKWYKIDQTDSTNVPVLVATLAEIYALGSASRAWGKFAVAYNDGVNTGTYQLTYNYVDTNLLNNANWKIFTSGTSGGGSGGSNLQRVANIAARNALVLTSTDDGKQVLVLNATGDGTVTSGWAIYEYIFATTSWRKIAEQESLETLPLSGGSITDGSGYSVQLLPNTVVLNHVSGKKVLLTGQTIEYFDGTYSAIINFPTLLANINYSLPARNGTLADNTDISGVLTTIKGGVVSAGDNLAKLYALIQTLNSIVGGTTADGDSVVNTVAELLSIFSTYPEGADVATALSGKINTSLIVNNLTEATTGKVLDASQGKALKDLIDGINTSLSGYTTNATGENTVDYTPADSDNTTGFFATLLTSGKLKIKSALDRMVATIKLKADLTLSNLTSIITARQNIGFDLETTTETISSNTLTWNFVQSSVQKALDTIDVASVGADLLLTLTSAGLMGMAKFTKSTTNAVVVTLAGTAPGGATLVHKDSESTMTAFILPAGLVGDEYFLTFYRFGNNVYWITRDGQIVQTLSYSTTDIPSVGLLKSELDLRIKQGGQALGTIMDIKTTDAFNLTLGANGVVKIKAISGGGAQVLGGGSTTGIAFEVFDVTGTQSRLKGLDNGQLSLTGAQDFRFETAGGGLAIKEGTNAKMGLATLVAGTVTVSTTKVTANSRINYSRKAINGSTALGEIVTGTVTAGTSFVINSVDPASPASLITGDTSIICWHIIEAL